MYKCNQKVFHFSYFFFPSFYHHQTIRVSSLPLNFQQPTNQASVLASCYCPFNLQPHYSFFKKKIYLSTMVSCCKGLSANCVCAAEARCSCGSRPARQCTCSRASEENTLSEARCTCGMRNAQECTCHRAALENGLRDGEVDFTNSF